MPSARTSRERAHDAEGPGWHPRRAPRRSVGKARTSREACASLSEIGRKSARQQVDASSKLGLQARQAFIVAALEGHEQDATSSRPRSRATSCHGVTLAGRESPSRARPRAEPLERDRAGDGDRHPDVVLCESRSLVRLRGAARRRAHTVARSCADSMAQRSTPRVVDRQRDTAAATRGSNRGLTPAWSPKVGASSQILKQAAVAELRGYRLHGCTLQQRRDVRRRIKRILPPDARRGPSGDRGRGSFFEPNVETVALRGAKYPPPARL